MKYLLISLLFLAGCEQCHREYDTKPDQGKCWKDCAISAAASEYYNYNFEACIQTACHYSSKRQCE